VTSALDAAAYRAAIGHFATGVTVVTAPGRDGPTGLTANAVCSLSLDPLLMLVCLDRGSLTLTAVERSRRLAVNVLAQDQQALATAFSLKAAEGAKFEGVGHHVVEGLPILDGVVAWLAGDVRDLLPGGDHVIGVTEVTGFDAPGGEPLVFHRGGYRSLGS
jgi:flavin reductase (DIM6/NTAB) family NADH-FMN oxidoreductase RutF